MNLYFIFFLAHTSSIWRLKKDFADYNDEYGFSATVEDSSPLLNLDAPEDTDISTSEFSAKDGTISSDAIDPGLPPIYYDVPEISATLDAFVPESPAREYDAPDETDTFNSTVYVSQNCSFRLLYIFN